MQKSPAPAPRDFSIAGAFGDGSSSGNSGTPTGGGSNGSGSSLIRSKSEFEALVASTDAKGYDITFVQNQNTITSGVKFTVVPWAGVRILISQRKVGNKFVVENVASQGWGMTLGYAWEQGAYSQNTNGTTTTTIVNGVWQYVIVFEGIGTVISSPFTYVVTINNKTGEIITGQRL